MSPAEIGAIAAVVGPLIMLACGWLRSRIKADLSDFMVRLEGKFLEQRVYEADTRGLEARLARIEGRVNHVAR